MNITVNEAKAMLYELKEMRWDHFFKAVFTKKDGTRREMLARFGVKKHLAGGVLAYNPKDYSLICVSDQAVLGKKAAAEKDLEAKRIIAEQGNAVDELVKIHKEIGKWSKESGYRMINFDTLISLMVDGVEYVINHEK